MIQRILFKNKILASNGQAFEDLFCKVMMYFNKNFRPVKPQGAVGDRKNDGFDDLLGVYYQVYAPENIGIKTAVTIKKIKDDFLGLYNQWPGINQFFFVVNDKYNGVHPDIELTLQELQDSHGIRCKPLLVKDLEEMFINLDIDKMKTIIGDFDENYELVYGSGFRYLSLQENRNFVGREIFIQGIKEFLDKKKGIQTVVIKGMGGIGKTQTALKYLYNFIDCYNSIFWINAESVETIESDTAEICNQLGISLEGKKNIGRNKNNSFIQMLEANDTARKWLLILDNAPSEDLLSPYIPRTGNGDVLITSQSDHWFNIDLPVELQGLSNNEAENLLSTYAQQKNENNFIAELADELANFPLALVQAGSYIRMAKITVEQYLIEIRDEKRKSYLLATSSPIKIKGVSAEYDFVVTTVWRKTFDNISKSSRISSEVICWLAFISNSIFPIRLLRILIKHLERQFGLENQVDTVIGYLTSYSLINIFDSGITIHKLVQWVTQMELQTDKSKILCSLSELLLDGSHFNTKERNIREELYLLLPHYISISRQLDVLKSNALETAQLSFTCGKFLVREVADYYGSLEHLKKSLEIWSIHLDDASSTRSEVMLAHNFNELAYAYENLGDYSSALSHYMNALNIDLKLHTLNPVNLAKSYNNIAVLYQQMGKYKEALAAFQKSLHLYSNLNDAEEFIVQTKSNIGAVYFLLGEFENAIQILRETISIEESLYGYSHINLANQYNNYAEALKEIGQYEEALVYYQKSITISDNYYLNHNPLKEKVLNNMGLLYISQFNIEKALQVFQDALKSVIAIYGTKHPNTSKTFINIGLAYMEKNNPREAYIYFNKALEIAEKVYSEMDAHPEMSKLLNNLGWCCESLDELEQAENYLLKSIKMNFMIYGTEIHPEIATTYINLAMVYSKMGELDSKYFQLAKEKYEKGISIDCKCYHENHIEVGKDYFNYGGLLFTINEVDRALAIFNQALLIFRSQFVNDHPRIADIHIQIATIYRRKGNDKLCREHLISAKGILVKFPEDEENSMKLQMVNLMLNLM
ncbi:tetratricopeptide repeat protein [Cohnella suwonensis]|uniref:Tetratricopeptide repeat protein n=1 Tax=Cohnella suwonensis TaxID=696072 RepID=A0ABW0M0B4_9BACL